MSFMCCMCCMSFENSTLKRVTRLCVPCLACLACLACEAVTTSRGLSPKRGLRKKQQLYFGCGTPGLQLVDATTTPPQTDLSVQSRGRHAVSSDCVVSPKETSRRAFLICLISHAQTNTDIAQSSRQRHRSFADKRKKENKTDTWQRDVTAWAYRLPV